ncbi:MAG TPA: hypothetical protein VGQ57_14440 [Polyangiaceae bacterium]|jgi:hypothetical protein|nr:hypothetical protein [Polyangiaceae bacterium]
MNGSGTGGALQKPPPPAGRGGRLGSGGTAARGGSSGLGAGGGLGGTTNPGGTGGIAGSDGGRSGEDTGGARDCVTDREKLAGTSFEAVLSGASTDENHWGQTVERSLLVHFTGASFDNADKVVFGMVGQAVSQELIIDDSSEFGTAIVFPDPFLLTSGPTRLGEPVLNVYDLDLCVDPSLESIEGSGGLTVYTEYDDYDDQWPADFRLKGVRDVTAPTFATAPADVDPLDPPTLPMSEPLALGAVAWLDWGDPAATQLDPVKQADTVVAFEVPVIPPLGANATLSALALDLAEHPVAQTAAFATVADPGVQALDGFESTLTVATLSSDELIGSPQPTLITSSDVISGAQSLRLPAGVKVLFHLRGPGTGGTLSFKLRPHNEGTVATNIVVRAGVVRDSDVYSTSLAVPAPIVLDDAAAGAAGAAATDQLPIQTVSVDLNPGDTDVLLTIQTPYVETVVLDAASAVVDDLELRATGGP